MNAHFLLKSLKVSGNSCSLGKYIVVRTGESTYRLGEAGGAWLMSGTADEVIKRAGKTSEVNATPLPSVAFDFDDDGVKAHAYIYEKARGASFDQIADNCAAFSHAHEMIGLLQMVAMGNTAFGLLEKKAAELLATVGQSKETIAAELKENFALKTPDNSLRERWGIGGQTQSDGPDHHVYGLHPMREADEEDRALPCRIVSIPIGFDSLRIAVYGDGLADSDAIEAAFEFLKEKKPDWCAPEAWEAHEEAAYVERPASARRR